MTETPEPSTEPTPTAAEQTAGGTAAVEKAAPRRLFHVAAWVGIVVGAVVIVAVIFWSGFVLGVHSGGCGHHRHHGEPGMMHHRGPGGWSQMGPGQMGPGPFPGGGPGEYQRPGSPGSPGPGNLVPPPPGPPRP